MTSWNFESSSVSGSGSKKETYSMPTIKTYVMIPNETDISNATKKINETLK